MIELIIAIALAVDGVQFPICGEGRRVTCVVDGDTFWHERIKYRIADIDAPEVGKPKCKAEARLGQEATFRLAALLSAGSFELETQGLDRYGRTLAAITRGGSSIGEQLVSEGLARRWGDRRGWC